ncbi:MAG: glycosyltransferase family 2 protein [Alphaproteobacteria bacterium]|nr:glycosyltransferase family 2 protein [Alphaproteobacteria bacterium]
MTEPLAPPPAPRLSALVVAHNEEARLEACLSRLAFADELVVVLDRCSDGSKAIAQRFAHRVVEGAWEIEGDRRNTGIDACAGDWVLEIDADEHVPPELAAEIRDAIAAAAQSGKSGWFLLPFDNYIGQRRVRYGWGGSFGTAAVGRLWSRGVKRWGRQRVHPSVTLPGKPIARLKTPVEHYVDRNISDMLKRLDRYSTARARDLRASGRPGSMAGNLRRFVTRFAKCYFSRGGWREGGWGVLVALCAGLFPLLSYLKATLEEE